MAGGMGAAVVRRKELDVLMKLSAIELVLDSVVGEMNLVVEVRPSSRDGKKNEWIPAHVSSVAALSGGVPPASACRAVRA